MKWKKFIITEIISFVIFTIIALISNHSLMLSIKVGLTFGLIIGVGIYLAFADR